MHGKRYASAGCLLLLLAAGSVYAEHRDFSTSDVTKVVMLGTGMPLPDPQRHGPGVAIIVNDTPYIIDAGEGVYQATGAATPRYGGKFEALRAPNLTRVFLTHLHSDHTVGLPSLIRSPFVMARTAPIEIWGPLGTATLVNHILAAYAEDLAERRYGVVQRGSEGWQAIPHEFSQAADGGEVYRDDNVKVEAFRVVHATWPHAYAYRFTTPDRIVVISGDLRPCEGIENAAVDADILIHEVIGLDDRDKQPWGKSTGTALELGDVAKHYHTTTKQLAELAQKVKPGVLVLYHEQNWSDPYDPDALADEVRRFGYQGKVISSRDQDIF